MKSASKKNEAPPPQPVDVVDGVPDRSAKPAAWKYLVLAVVFLLWAAVLFAVLNGWL